jgi:hypothetical protein
MKGASASRLSIAAALGKPPVAEMRTREDSNFKPSDP